MESRGQVVAGNCYCDPTEKNILREVVRCETVSSYFPMKSETEGKAHKSPGKNTRQEDIGSFAETDSEHCFWGHLTQVEVSLALAGQATESIRA
jgi:hypothetical protein